MPHETGHLQRPSRNSNISEGLTRGRFATCLALSLALHAGVTGMIWLDVRTTPSAADVTFVDLSPLPGPRVTPVASDRGDEENSRPLATDGESMAVGSAPQPTAAQTAETHVATLEAAREDLQGRVDSLTSENTELSARLDAERERAAALERQLQDAREAEQARRDTERERAAALERQLQDAREAEETRLARMRTDYDDVVTALQSEIADKVIALHRANERLTVTIVDRVLFPSGQAMLTPEGRRVMARVGAVLARVSDRAILVEGHTDDVPIGPALRERFPSNWELSAARATEVVRFLAGEAGVSPERLRAAGRADTEPAASNATEEGRRQNRRIEIIMLPPGQPSRAHEPS